MIEVSPQQISVWLVIGLALLAANLPFSNQRIFAFGPRLPQGKSLFVCLLELVALYGVVGLTAVGLERRLGQVASQGWEFYAVTATLFLTLAFPGFVLRFLMDKRSPT